MLGFLLFHFQTGSDVGYFAVTVTTITTSFDRPDITVLVDRAYNSGLLSYLFCSAMPPSYGAAHCQKSNERNMRISTMDKYHKYVYSTFKQAQQQQKRK